MKYLYISLICILVSTGTFAQNNGLTALPKNDNADELKSFAYNNLNFKQITKSDGLSDNVVTGIVQDQFGFMWFATPNGLNRYDGHGILVIRHDSLQNNSLSSNKISAICKDSHDRIWIGTDNGLNLFDPLTYKCIRYQSNSFTNNSLSSNNVTNIYEDRSGRIWVFAKGLNCLNPETGKISRYKHLPNDSLSPNIFMGNQIIQDAGGKFWLGTWKDWVGVDTFRYEKGVFYHTRFKGRDKRQGKDLSPELVSGMFGDSKNNIWFGCFTGLYFYDWAGRTFTYYNYHDPNNQFGAVIQGITEDNYGNIWLGTYGNGLFIYEPGTKRFVHFLNDHSNVRTLGDNRINSIYKDKTGSIWLATDNGVSFADVFVNQFNALKYTTDYRNISVGQSSLVEDKKGNLWADAGVGIFSSGGTYEGFTTYNRQTNKFSTPQKTLDNKKINGFQVSDEGTLYAFGPGEIYLIKDEKQVDEILKLPSRLDIISLAFNQKEPLSFWTVTNKIIMSSNLKSRFPVEYFPREIPWQKSVTREKYNFELLSAINTHPRWMNMAISDNDNQLWVIGEDEIPGSSFLYRLDNTGKLKKFRQTFISNLYSIGKDSKGRILICCESGLYAYDKPDNKLTNYTSLGALPIGKVLGVAEDLQGYLWVVYPFGISRYNPQNNTSQTFYCGKDLPVTGIPLLIKQNIHFGQSTHQLYVATQDGILAFRPDLIKYNSVSPPTYLTYFKKFNQSIPFDTALFVKKKIVLQHNEAFFTVGFSALSYSNHELNKYQYKLENLDNDWTTTSQTEAKYTSVPYGKYVFRVKGCNDKGIWNATEAVLEITVLPPFWQTWLAYVLYALFLVFLIYAIVKLNTFRLQKEKLHLESIVNQRTTELKETNSELVQQKEEIQVLAEQLTIQNDRLLELDRFKQGMTSMIVHDMKNPLNMINAGLDRLDAETLKKLKNSVKHLVHLVENVLDVNRMERQKLNLATTAVNLYRTSNVAIKQIEYLSKAKFISIENEINNHHTVIANADFLERIFLNLLTNSIKYTPINGKIVLNSEQIEGQYVRISITDNGCGIPAEKIGQVFDSYFQHNPQKSGNMAATGIGLTFCKYAVLEQNGQMGAESDGTNGTKFWFTLKVAETTDNQVYTNDTKSSIATFDLDSVSIPKVVINQLLEIPIFKASDIFAILVHIPSENQANKEWVEQVKNAIFTGNEKMYKHLIDSVKK